MSSTAAPALAAQVKGLALEMGFELAGIATPAPDPAAAAAYQAWLAEGHHGPMAYLARPDRVERALDPGRSLPELRSVLVVGKNYFSGLLPPELTADPSRGLFASYAWADDYHELLSRRLEDLRQRLAAELGRAVGARVYVDHGPLLERDLGQRAGLGFIGRNTMLIHPRWGSWFFLAELLLDLDLPADAPETGIGCGRCQRCLPACPTDAFPAPYVLDARRCISTLTIELKGPIPTALRPLLGNRVFGCDLCNEACPYNRRFARPSLDAELAPDPARLAPPLLDLIALDEAGFRSRFGHTAVARSRRRGLLRNVCVALGNWASPQALPALAAALQDTEPLIRGHAAWALGRLRRAPDAAAARRARSDLRAAARLETDPWVAAELAAARGDGEEVVRPEGGPRMDRPLSLDEAAFLGRQEGIP